MKLWLDDVRDPTQYAFYREGVNIKGGYDYIWVKTADEAIALLKTGKVTYASLDHDLAFEHYMGQEFVNGTSPNKTGYDVVLWMESNSVWPIDGTVVHSMNPVGRKKMQAVIDKWYRK